MGNVAMKDKCELKLFCSQCSKCQLYLLVQVVLTGHSRITKSAASSKRAPGIKLGSKKLYIPPFDFARHLRRHKSELMLGHVERSHRIDICVCGISINTVP